MKRTWANHGLWIPPGCLAKTGAVILAALLLNPIWSWAQPEPLLNPEKHLVSEPAELVRQLLSAEMSQRIAALEILGVPETLGKPPPPGWEDFTKVVDARVVYANLDEDPELEAIVVFAQGPYAWAAVLDREDDRWYRVALLNCWCKYEADPLARFIELRTLVDPGRRDLIVRDSLGGTGVYWRDAIMYRMKTGSLHEVLRIHEEKRNCDPTAPPERRGCSVTRASVSFLQQAASRRVVVSTVQGQLPVPPPQRGEPPVYPPPGDDLRAVIPVGCQGYAWDASRFRFAEDPRTTSIYCEKSKKIGP